MTALLIIAAGFVLEPVTAQWIKAVGSEGVAAGMARLAVWPAWFRLSVGATGGIVEETLYRGCGGAICSPTPCAQRGTRCPFVHERTWAV